MRGRKLIAILLMLVFSIPLAPVSQVGDLLSSNQLQEEIMHNTCKEIHKAESDMTLHPPSTQTLHPEPLYSPVSLYSRQADDIFTPPPNL
jgi:hypothetical protein